jgi:hypothetical protein
VDELAQEDIDGGQKGDLDGASIGRLAARLGPDDLRGSSRVLDRDVGGRQAQAELGAAGADDDGDGRWGGVAHVVMKYPPAGMVKL